MKQIMTVLMVSLFCSAQAMAQSAAALPAAPETVTVDLSKATSMAAAAHQQVQELAAKVAELEKKAQQAQSRGASTSTLRAQLETKKQALLRAQARLSKIMAERDEATAALAAAKIEVATGRKEVDLGAQTTTLGIVKAQLGFVETSPLEDLTNATVDAAEFAVELGAQQATPLNLQVKTKCSHGTEISSVYDWGKSYYACVQPPNLVPAKKDRKKKVSKVVSCLPWAGIGVVGGGSGGYGIGRALGRQVDFRDVLISAGELGAVTYGICLLVPEEEDTEEEE